MTSQAFQHIIVRYAVGDRIFTEGDLGATMYIVQSGKVRLFRISAEHKRTDAVLEKGDFFGEASVIDGLSRTSSAEAIEDAELVEINATTFDRMIKANIEIAVRMLRKLSLRLRDAERRLDDLGPAPAPLAPAPRVLALGAAAGEGRSAVRLEVEGESMTFPLSDSDSLIGRYDPITDLKPDVDLSSLDLKRTVSRSHARIFRTSEGRFIAEEVGAMNSTLVNGTRLVTGRPHRLADGDRITLGAVKLVFRS